MAYLRENSPLYQLLLTGRKLVLPRGQVVDVFNDSARCNLIQSGYIKRYLITAEGTQSIQVIYGPDDIFPLTPVYKGTFAMDIYSGPEQYYYEAMTDIVVYSIDQAELQKAAQADPLIYKDLFYAAGLRLNSYIHRLESMSLKAANRKVAHQLAYLADVFGTVRGDDIVLDVALTHQNIAEILNLARETVTHCLSYLQDKGLITVDKNFVIHDVEKLRSFRH